MVNSSAVLPHKQLQISNSFILYMGINLNECYLTGVFLISIEQS